MVVADPERSEKTICLAVSPAMKALGVPGRCRVFEIPKQIQYIMAPPRMALYINKRFEKKSAHGTISMPVTTSSAKQMKSYAVQLYDRIIDRYTPIHRFTVTFNNVMDELFQQYDLFTDVKEVEKEHKIQKVVLDIKEKFGKNAILKGMNLQKGATTIERNQQIGGHKSGD